MGVPTFDPQKFSPPAPPFDASKAKGKVIFNIPISSALPFIKGIDEGQQQAADAVGATIVNFPNQGTVAEWVKGFDQAISRKADLIVLDAAPNPAQLQPQLQRAKAAGIPVLATHMPLDSEFPPGSLPPTNLANVTAVVPGPFPLASKLQADYTVANTPDGNVHALILTSNEVAASKGIVQMTQDEFKSVCPECKTTVVNVPLNDWATKLQSATQSALLKDPSINWVIPIYDSMSQFVVPGIQAAQKTDKVHVATFNGTSFVMKMIQDQDVVSMDIGESLNWLGWAFMDQAFRILSGVEPVKYTTAPTPVRIWDDSNIAEAGNPPKDSTGYGGDYIPGYKALWGLTK
jgi:ribose transport system substrate-binding protein